MPDDALFAAAAEGRLADGSGIAEQARRMLADPKARPAIATFTRQWLGLDAMRGTTKDEAAYPAFDAPLGASMVRSVERFATGVILDGDGTFDSLLLSREAWLDEPLAAFYGVTLDPAAPAEDGLRSAVLPQDERAGLLTRAGVMAVHGHANQTAPVQRGRFVREHLLCQSIPDPPPDVDDTPPAVDPTLPTKQRFEAHRSVPSCAGCHELLDPIGFGFEHYDGSGHYRAWDGDNPVDAAGYVVGAEGLEGGFTGAIELSEKLADSDLARACLTRQLFRFGLSRPETSDDDETLASVADRFAASNDIRELLLAIVTSPAFRLRVPAEEK